MASAIRVGNSAISDIGTMRQAGRVLGVVLIAAGVVWIAAAALTDRPTDIGLTLWGLAMLLIGVGAWAPFLAAPNVLSGVGALAASIGALLLSILLLRDLTIIPPRIDGLTIQAIAVALTGFGAALIGASLFMIRRRALAIGAVIAIGGIAWAVAGLTDYGSDFEHWISILAALAFLAIGVVAIRPPLPRFVIRWLNA